MARISGVNIPLNKRVEIGLTYIYGIGRSTSNKLLAEVGVEPDRKVRDLTEEEVVNNLSMVRTAARELRTYGITFAVDGFGVSYADLAREKDLPFNEVKIYRSYISHCDTDVLNAGLCETIVEFAHRFHMNAVAEGIETKGELQTLRSIGCDMGQGYFFARPMPKDKFTKLVLERVKPAAPKAAS